MNFLLGALLITVVGVAIVVWRHRPRSSMNDTISGFSKGLDALAPEDDPLEGR